MLSPLRVLTVVDHPDHARPLIAELERGGLVQDWKWVRTETEFVAALENPPDLILLKANQTELNAERAREMVRSHKVQAPVIVVADEAGGESETLFRRLFDQSALGVYCLDLQGSFTQANQRMCDFVGYTADELTWRRYSDIIHPADLGLLETMYQQMLAGAVHHISIAQRYRCKNGEITLADYRGWLLRNAEDKPIGIGNLIEPVITWKADDSKSTPSTVNES